MTKDVPSSLSPIFAMTRIEDGGDRVLIGCQDGLFVVSPGAAAIDIGPAGAAVTALASNRELVIAGGIGGCLRSTNHGTTWTASAWEAPPPLVTSLALDGKVILAGTLEDGVFRSPDGGESWFHSSAGLLDHRIRKVVCGHGVAVLASETLAWISMNSGVSWTQCRQLDDVCPLSNATIYLARGEPVVVVSTDTGQILRSLDCGATWAAVGRNDRWADPLCLLGASGHGKDRLFVVNEAGIDDVVEQRSVLVQPVRYAAGDATGVTVVFDTGEIRRLSLSDL